MAVFTYISPLLVIATVIGYTIALVCTSMVHENLKLHKVFLGPVLSKLSASDQHCVGSHSSS